MSDMSMEQAAEMVEALESPEAAGTGQEIPGEGLEAEAEGFAPEVSDDGEAEAGSVIEVPRWWDKDAQAHFADLPPEAQAIVRAQEDKREAVVQKEKAYAQDARRAAMAEVDRVRAASERIGGILPDRLSRFQSEYGDIDWEQMPQWAADNPDDYHQWMAVYSAERLALENTLHAKAEADAVAQDAFAREQATRFAEIAPDLIGNPDSLRALGHYAQRTGIPAEAYRMASADELVILNKARLYDDMMAKAAARSPSAQSKNTPARIAPQGGVRPAGTSQQRAVQETRNRLAQTRSIDDAASLISKLGY